MRVAGSAVQFSPSVNDATAREPRFMAYVAVSPQGEDYVGMTATSWDAITAPILIMLTGVADNHAPERGPDRLAPWRRLPPAARGSCGPTTPGRCTPPSA